MNEKVLNEARQIMAGFFKQRREELGLSQEALAERVGCARATINRIEQAHFWPSMTQCLQICEALHLFPTVVEIEADEPIAEALRKNWVPHDKAMSIDDALQLKSRRNKRRGDGN